MNNDNKTQILSPKDKAKEFWSDIVYQHGFARIDTLLGLTKKRYPEKLDGSDILSTNPEDYSYANFVEWVKEDKLKKFEVNCHNRTDFMLLVKPNLPWDEIEKLFDDIEGIEKETIELIVFILKPFPLENEMEKGIPKVEKVEKDICTASNQVIKRLSPIIRQLEQVTDKRNLPMYNAPGFLHALGALKEEVKYHREIVKMGKDLHKHYLKVLAVDKDVEKIDPRKHKFWSVSVSTAISVINDFCHNYDCDQDICKKTHKKALRKVAELLRILYPTIWNSGIKHIVKLIEQREYRSTP